MSCAQEKINVHFQTLDQLPLLAGSNETCVLNYSVFFQVYEHADGSKSLKLGDFGLATVVDGPLYTVCGTPTYVAPEIIAETG